MTEVVIVNALAAIINLTIRLIESKEQSVVGMARSDESEAQAIEELTKATASLDAAIARAKGVRNV